MAVGLPAASLRKVEFRLSRAVVPSARRVSLVGSFNDWVPGMHELIKQLDGDWVTTVYLLPGVYTYLFIVDGHWYNDPRDDGRTNSGWGNEYSLKVVR